MISLKRFLCIQVTFSIQFELKSISATVVATVVTIAGKSSFLQDISFSAVVVIVMITWKPEFANETYGYMLHSHT